MLSVHAIDTYYDTSQVLFGMSLEVAAGQVTLKPLRAEAEQQTIPDAELETFLAGYLATAQSA